MCASCPQACITPSRREAYGASFASRIGRASISARRATVGPGRLPSRSASKPVPATPDRTQSSRGRSSSSTVSEVRCSSKRSSGFLWKLRRTSISFGSKASRTCASFSRKASCSSLIAVSTSAAALSRRLLWPDLCAPELPPAEDAVTRKQARYTQSPETGYRLLQSEQVRTGSHDQADPSPSEDRVSGKERNPLLDPYEKADGAGAVTRRRQRCQLQIAAPQLLVSPERHVHIAGIE